MFDNMNYIAKRFLQRPLRSFLTVFQLSLGIWLVAVIFSMYFQADSQLQRSSHMLDSQYARLQLVTIERQTRGTFYRNIAALERPDLAALQEQSENIETAFFSRQALLASIGYDEKMYTIQSIAETNASFAEAANLELVEGYFFSELDEFQGSKVALISEDIRDYLFPDEQALGKMILRAIYTGSGMERVEQYLEIIGVYRKTDPIVGDFIGDSHILVPYGSGVMSPRDGGEHTVYIKAVPGRLAEAIQDAQTVLVPHLVDGAILRVETLQERWEAQKYHLNVLSVFLGVFGFVALAVSAVGVLCILLVSVYERTKEIGLRRALGASRAAIVKQFLGESLLYTVLGALLGVPAAFISAERLGIPLVIELYFGLDDGVWHFSWLAAVYALILASLATLIMSFYPAFQAAKIPPTEALREQ